MPFRSAFLIVAAGLALHVPFLWTCLALTGYLGCAALDKWLAKLAKDKLYEDELVGWNTDKGNTEYEGNGRYHRRRLPETDEIVVTRIADLLRKML